MTNILDQSRLYDIYTYYVLSTDCMCDWWNNIFYQQPCQNKSMSVTRWHGLLPCQLPRRLTHIVISVSTSKPSKQDGPFPRRDTFPSKVHQNPNWDLTIFTCLTIANKWTGSRRFNASLTNGELTPNFSKRPTENCLQRKIFNNFNWRNAQIINMKREGIFPWTR